ncbi:hypothetical protein CBS101457_002536 [Exobasidium rhododendri]|nr:hypothetical protein CBS101457_002536 [Exobasidium rhododendri]
MLVLVIGDLHLPNRASDLPNKFRKLLVPGKIQQIICTGNVCDRETLDYLRTIAGDVHVVKGDWDENPHFPNSLILHHPPLRIGVLHGHQIVPSGDVDSLCSIARAMDVDLLVTGHTHRFDAFEKEGRFFVNPGSATGAWSSVWPVKEGDEEEEEKEGEKKDGEKEEKETEKSTEQKPKASVEDEKAEKDEKKVEKFKDEASSSTNEKEEASKNAEESPEKAKAAELPEPKAAPGPTPSFALLDVQGPVVVTYVYQLIEGEVKVEKMEFRKKLDNAPTQVPAAGQRRSVGTARN